MPAQTEVINEFNGELANLYRVVQHHKYNQSKPSHARVLRANITMFPRNTVMVDFEEFFANDSRPISS